jgi:tRNA threonylcarbamoyladenosine biosynthesis protein TsaE
MFTKKESQALETDLSAIISLSSADFSEKFFSHSPEETMAWARQKGTIIEPPLTIILTGSLGVGKTVMVRGLAAGLGVEDEGEVSSPSYTLLNTYSTSHRIIHHLDLYRLSNARDLENIGLFELLEDPKAILMIEWGELAIRWISHAWHIHIEDEGSVQRRILLRRF